MFPSYGKKCDSVFILFKTLMSIKTCNVTFPFLSFTVILKVNNNTLRSDGCFTNGSNFCECLSVSMLEAFPKGGLLLY